MVSPCPNSGEHLLKESAGDISEKDYAVHWLKFIFSMSSKTGITGLSIPRATPVHMAYSPLASMNSQWIIHLNDGYPLLCLVCFTLVLTTFTPPKNPNMILSSLAPPNREMASSFSYTSIFKSPTPRALYLGDPTLELTMDLHVVTHQSYMD